MRSTGCGFKAMQSRSRFTYRDLTSATIAMYTDKDRED